MPPIDYAPVPDVLGFVEFRDADDPTGNGQPTEEAIFKDANGAEVRSGLFLQRYAGQPKIRVVRGNPGAGAADVLVLDPDGRVSVANL
jgi:hypothetical protein